MKIIHPNPERPEGICLIIPAPNCGLTIEEIARKDTPAGLPYIIVEDADVPDDLYFMEAWEADFSTPDGYGIGHDAWFAEQAAAQAAAEAAAQEPTP